MSIIEAYSNWGAYNTTQQHTTHNTKPSKMIGQVAIQRKLLTLMYALWKTNSEFNPEYKKVASSIKMEKATLDTQ